MDLVEVHAERGNEMINQFLDEPNVVHTRGRIAAIAHATARLAPQAAVVADVEVIDPPRDLADRPFRPGFGVKAVPVHVPAVAV